MQNIPTLPVSPASPSQEFAETVRTKGDPKHWQLHCGLSWIAQRFERGHLKAEGTDAEDVQAALTSLLALPGKAERAAIGTAALLLLRRYGPQLSASDYAAIYLQLHEGSQ